MRTLWTGAVMIIASASIGQAEAHQPVRTSAASTTRTSPSPRLSNAQIEARRSAAFQTCMRTGEAARGVTAGMMDCFGSENKRQDDRLNSTYRRLMARQSRSGKLRLQSLQRAWIPERDATCKRVANEAGGGTLSMTLFSDCFMTETIRRTVWLERYRG